MSLCTSYGIIIGLLSLPDSVVFICTIYILNNLYVLRYVRHTDIANGKIESVVIHGKLQTWIGMMGWEDNPT